VVKPLPHRRYRLHAARRHLATDDGLQAETGFSLGEDLHREPVAVPSEWLSELSGQGRGELRHGLWTFFSWAGRGGLGFARSSLRTNA
jgi:hypothetical protein